MISFIKFCAFRLPKERGFSSEIKSVPFEIVPLAGQSIDALFKDDHRLPAFRRFLANGAAGWLLTDGPRWVSYGWVTNCAVFMPPHVGNNLRASMDWIFFCGTHPDYRGRGAFQTLLARMVKTRVANPDRELYIDTLVDNVASRRGVEKVGFQPHGMIWSLSMRIPKRQPLVVSGWNRSRPHPSLACP